MFVYSYIIHMCRVYENINMYMLHVSILYSYFVGLEDPKSDELYSSLGPPSVNKIMFIILLL